MAGWFLAGVCTALAAQAAAQECGREILAYNFDDHPGPFAAWTEDSLQATWPKGALRYDFRGSQQIPGLIYSKGIERASVGEEQLRLFMPKVCIILTSLNQFFTFTLGLIKWKCNSGRLQQLEPKACSHERSIL